MKTSMQFVFSRIINQSSMLQNETLLSST